MDTGHRLSAVATRVGHGCIGHLDGDLLGAILRVDCRIAARPGLAWMVPMRDGAGATGDGKNERICRGS